MPVNREKEDLAVYIRRVREEKGFSLKDIQRNAKASGHSISSGYISQIENRYVSNPTKDKLAALARGLKVPEEEVFRVAQGQKVEENADFIDSVVFELYEKRKAASPEKRAFIDKVIQMLVEDVDRDQRQAGGA